MTMDHIHNETVLAGLCVFKLECDEWDLSNSLCPRPID